MSKKVEYSWKNNSSGREKRRETLSHVLFWSILAILLTVLLTVYLLGVRHFSSHYFPKTTIGRISCGMKDADYVLERNRRASNDYLFTIYDIKGNKFHIAGTDIDYHYVERGEEKAILESQNPWKWPLELTREHACELTYSTEYDDSHLQELVEATGLADPDYCQEPRDAWLEITSKGYLVHEEVQGNMPDIERITQVVRQAMAEGAYMVNLTSDCYRRPIVCKDDASITDRINLLESYLSATITYNREGINEKLGRNDIMRMLKVDEDGSVNVDNDKVYNYVQQLASRFNTYADKRRFITTAGDTIEIGGGDYGWVVDKAKETAQIIADIKSGQAVTRDIVWNQKARQFGADDIGNTYIEVDYDAQHFWYYQEGQLMLESDFVSGNIRKKNGSVDGVYKIVYKQKDATLVGENYASAVDYFLPFAYNIGFHDASWRSSFGGDIYKSNGSHGCINLPHDIAEKMYHMVAVDTPVIAYYRTEVTLTNNAAKVSNAYSYKDNKK